MSSAPVIVPLLSGSDLPSGNRLGSERGEKSMTLPRGQSVINWQKDQYAHDKRNHFDILTLSKSDRLKHFALHFAKYAGRLARGENAAQKTELQTAIDSLLVSLSAANTISQRLETHHNDAKDNREEIFRRYVDAMGHFCDAVEKLDHAEFDNVRKMLLVSNQELFSIAVLNCQLHNVDIKDELILRRSFLSERAFFAGD